MPDLCVSRDLQGQKGFLVKSTPLNIWAVWHLPKRIALGLFWEARRRKRQVQEGYSEPSGTHRQTRSRLFRKSSLQSCQLQGWTARSLWLLRLASPFLGSWPLPQWFSLESDHTHMWLIIFGKYLNNLVIRQERTNMVKSMPDWTKKGTGSWAMRVCDKESSSLWVYRGLTAQPEKYHLSYRDGMKISQAFAKGWGSLRQTTFLYLYISQHEWEDWKWCILKIATTTAHMLRKALSYYH